MYWQVMPIDACSVKVGPFYVSLIALLLADHALKRLRAAQGVLGQLKTILSCDADLP